MNSVRTKFANIDKIKVVWFIAMWIGICIFVIRGLQTHGANIIRVLHRFDNDTFMDLFNSMSYERTPYENRVIYPPIVNLFYYILHAFIPQDTFQSGMIAVRDSQMGRLLLGMYITITTLVISYMVCKIKEGIVEEKFFFLVTILLTMPFIYQLERANMILISLFFLGIYVYGYNSEDKYLKHIAFISLAVATAIKIYPVFFGLLLIREDRWKDAGICILYGVIVFFFPFIFFGGIKNIGLFVDNIISCSNNMTNAGEGLKVNISNTITIISMWIFDGQDRLGILALVMKFICFLGGIIIILFANYMEQWKIYMIPTLMMILLPDFSFQYTLIFMIIPLMFFLDEKKRNKMSVVYLMLFIGVMIPLPNYDFAFLELFENDYYPLTSSIIVISIILLLFMMILWYEGFASILKKRE